VAFPCVPASKTICLNFMVWISVWDIYRPKVPEARGSPLHVPLRIALPPHLSHGRSSGGASPAP
jgi:hypothetical protein